MHLGTDDQQQEAEGEAVDRSSERGTAGFWVGRMKRTASRSFSRASRAPFNFPPRFVKLDHMFSGCRGGVAQIGRRRIVVAWKLGL